ncbi:MAG TPA: 1,4-dihydroxy-2-naphthoate polyprenyltransferase [Mycobacteriales bacterium]|nr:1,4-dihydroxy-2-naphthoate polyprenyltransferase [Mycobacteriales bacterium]
MSQAASAHGGQPAGAGLSEWIQGARPRTLTVSVVPVLVGAGAAAAEAGFVWWRAIVALFVSLALQIGVNYSNDYSDGIRGTDADRVGPMRLTASGLVRPRAVLLAACAWFFAAAVAGLALAIATSWWLILIGALAIAAAWFYTGGKRPYGYNGFGDISVFVFFGLVAVLGTAYCSSSPSGLSWLAVLAAIPCGLHAVAVLVANNLRDIPKDAETGKRTLAVILGDQRTRLMYVVCLLAPFAFTVALAALHPWSLLSLAALILAVPPIRAVRGGVVGRELIAVLIATSRLQLVYGVLLALGLAL